MNTKPLTEETWAVIAAAVVRHLANENEFYVAVPTFVRAFGLPEVFYRQLLAYAERDLPEIEIRAKWWRAVPNEPCGWLRFLRRYE